jgi:hypothetical protein
MFGQSIDVRIGYDRIEPVGLFPIRYWRDDFIRTGGMRNEQERAKRLRTLLAHLTEQTGLKVEVRKMSFPVWCATE